MWAASKNHLSVCRRKPDMLENIWYAARPEEWEKEKDSVGNAEKRSPSPPLLPFPRQQRQQVRCNSNRVDKDTRLFCISVYQIKSCKVTISLLCGNQTGMMATGSGTFFHSDCRAPVLMFVGACVQISQVSPGVVLTLKINEWSLRKKKRPIFYCNNSRAALPGPAICAWCVWVCVLQRVKT